MRSKATCPRISTFAEAMYLQLGQVFDLWSRTPKPRTQNRLYGIIWSQFLNQACSRAQEGSGRHTVRWPKMPLTKRSNTSNYKQNPSLHRGESAERIRWTMQPLLMGRARLIKFDSSGPMGSPRRFSST